MNSGLDKQTPNAPASLSERFSADTVPVVINEHGKNTLARRESPGDVPMGIDSRGNVGPVVGGRIYSV